MAVKPKVRKFAPEMGKVKELFAGNPQIYELIQRLREIDRIAAENIDKILEGEDGQGVALVNWFLNSVFKGSRPGYDVESVNGNLVITLPLILDSDRAKYSFEVKPGLAVAPFTKLFEWNRSTEAPDFSFQSVFVSGTPPGPTWNRTVVTAQSSTAILVTPYFELKTSGPPAAHEDGFLLAANGMSANLIKSVRQDIEFIVTVGDLSTAGIDTAGFIIAKNGSETTDYYLVGLTSTNIKVWKRIAGTYYLQGDMQGWAGPNAKAFSRIRVVLTSTGRLRVFGATNTTDMFDLPMTQSNTTVISSGDVVKPGILLGYRGSPVSMTFAIMNAWSAPIGADGEQMRL